MKIFAWGVRPYDEKQYFERYGKEFDVEIKMVIDEPTIDNAYMVEGYDCISILTFQITEEMMKRYAELGVKYISTRCVGYDHIDLNAAKKYGIGVGNATYDVECVADYAMMLILMTLRKVKRILEAENINDFSLKGHSGGILRRNTVGVIGTGRIGTQVIKDLSGFGCKILAYDRYQNEEVKKYATYVSLEELFHESNIITLHMNLNEDNYHMINQETINQMRDGVLLINTARGPLIDTDALIDGLMSQKIGGVGLDCIEDEFGMYYHDCTYDILDKKNLYILRGLPNVIVTPHMAFYTDYTVADVVKHSIESCKLEMEGKENPWKIL